MQKEINKVISRYWQGNPKDWNAFIDYIALTEKSEIKETGYCRYVSLFSHKIAVNIIFIQDYDLFKSNCTSPKLNYLVFSENISDDYIQELENRGLRTGILYESDIDNIIQGEDINDIIAFKTYSTFVEGKGFKESIFVKEVLEDFIKSIKNTTFNIEDFTFEKRLNNLLPTEKHPRYLIEHSQESNIRNEILEQEFRLIFLTGDSASGKSSIALHSLYKIAKIDAELLYLDAMALDNSTLISLFNSLYTKLAERKVIIVFEDLHSNIYISIRLMQMLNIFSVNRRLSKNLTVIGIVWNEFLDELCSYLKFIPSIYRITSKEIERRLTLKKMSDAVAANMLRYAEGNLFLLDAVIDRFDKKDSFNRNNPTEEIPHFLLNRLNIQEDEKAKRIVYIISLLGIFEIDTTIEFLVDVADVEKDDVILLFKNRIIKRRGDAYSLGHKAYCKLINEAFNSFEKPTTLWFLENKDLKDTTDILLDYLAILSTDKIYSVLKKLYKNASYANIGNENIIIETWQSIDFIINKLILQHKQDYTWNNAISNVMFALNALTSVGYRDDLHKSIEYIRTFYSNDMTIDLSKEANVRDFELIKNEMILQDSSETLIGEKGVELIPEMFHKAWGSGVIVCCECYYGEFNKEQLKVLAKNIEKTAIDGKYFYPERVPWSTSRVLIGLSLCGRNIKNSVIVKNVANWLLYHPNYSEGRWQSGTGSWNNWIETTSLAVIALVKVGVSPFEENIQAAIKALFDAREVWIEKSKEVDGVTALQAYALAEGDLTKVLSEIQYFSGWMKNNASIWTDNDAALSALKQSCAVTQIASGLIDVMWKFLQADLPSLIKSFEILHKKGLKVPRIFISYSWDDEVHINWVNTVLVKNLINRYGEDCVNIDKQGVYDYKSTYQFMEKEVEKADIYIAICTEKYRKKADEREGGVGEEADLISRQKTTKNKRLISLIRQGDAYVSIPSFMSGSSNFDFVKDDKFEQNLIELFDAINHSLKNFD